MRPFVFSCDAHIVEPATLFQDKLPEHLKHFAPYTVNDGKFSCTYIGDALLLKMPVDFMKHKTGYDNGDPMLASVNMKRRGARDLDLRLEDMDLDGVDAELVFPSLGLMLPRINDREAQRAACQIWNDWAWDYTAPVRERLIPSAMIPCIDLDDALEECVRVAGKGFAAFTLWEGLENYNDPRWDPIFAFAGANDIPIVFHTGVGNISLRPVKGAGGALYNYTRQMNDAVDIIALLIGGGVLDRNPKTHILFAEHSAGWLAGLAERMDEVYHGHAPSIIPKLSRLPSQIVREQVHCALQNDVGALITRKIVGIDALLFATDYPHSEGTFPFSRKVVDRLTSENPDLTMVELIAVLGGNAAKLFKHANLQTKVAARANEIAATATA